MKVPHKKVQAGGVGGAVATFLVLVASLFGVTVPPEAAAALTTLVSFVAGYLQPAP